MQGRAVIEVKKRHTQTLRRHFIAGMPGYEEKVSPAWAYSNSKIQLKPVGEFETDRPAVLLGLERQGTGGVIIFFIKEIIDAKREIKLIT